MPEKKRIKNVLSLRHMARTKRPGAAVVAGLVAAAVGTLVILALVSSNAAVKQTGLVQPSHAVKHQEELDEDHAILQNEEESEGIYRSRPFVLHRCFLLFVID